MSVASSELGATERLRTLARALADTYLSHCRPRAILVVGSAASGDADAFSDLDMLLYYAEPPGEAALAGARGELDAQRFEGTHWPDDSGYSERYYVDGVQCQVGHSSIRGFEREIAKLLVELELDQALPKIMSGLFEGLALHGEDLIERWRREAAYTEPLQRAMIERHWQFFPWWFFAEKLRARDATVWRYDVLVRSAYSIVGVLAALNRVYFSTFEFKRMTKFIAQLEVSPPNLAARLEALFESDERESTDGLERLVEETRALAAERFPDLDLSLRWGGRPTPPGSRETPWQ